MKNVIAVAVRGLKRDSWNLILVNDWLCGKRETNLQSNWF